MTTKFYAIAMHDQPDEPFDMIAIETTPTTETPLRLNRATKAWEEDGEVLDYFVGESSGQRAISLSRKEAVALAKTFGADLP
jgi:hypothetical protein